jgi:hypothetical protein
MEKVRGNLLKSEILGLEALVAALGGADDWGVGDQWVVDSGVWDQVGLELVQVNVQGTIETKGAGDGGDNLSDESVEVLKGWARNVQVATANVVNGLVVDQECAVTVLDGAVGGEDSVVWLNNSG